MGDTPQQVDWQNDPDFHALPLAEKHKVLLQVDPDYKGLPAKEQAKALDAIHYGNLGQTEKTGVVGALKGMIPPPPGGNAPILSKEFWLGKEAPGVDITRPGSVVSDVTRPLPSNLPTAALTDTASPSRPMQTPLGNAIYRGASIFSPMGAESAEEASGRGDTSNVITQAAVPAALTLAGPLLGRAMAGREGSVYVPPSERVATGGGGISLTPAEALEFVHSPVRAALKYGAKRLFGEKVAAPKPEPTPFPGATSTEAPIGNAKLPPVPKGEPTPFPKVQKLSDIKAAAKAEAKAAEAARKGGMAPPPALAGMTSTAVPIGNAPLPAPPAVPPTTTGAPVAGNVIRMGTGIGAEELAAPTNGKTSLLSRGRTLVEPGLEPDMNNPVHVKMINDYQTMSGPALRQLASAGDRFAAFVLRHMPRP